MTTIEIVQEQVKAKTIYRAICGMQQAAGKTLGQALDLLEQELAAKGIGESGNILIIVQRFRPDNLFTAEQQLRLRELMDRFHQANALGQTLAPDEQQELEQLVDAEWNAAIERSATIISRNQPETQ
jgi:hypothetical protein